MQAVGIDLGRGHDHDGVGQSSAHNLAIHPLAHRRREQFGIGETVDLPPPSRGQDARRDDERPGAGATARLVGARHEAEPGPRQRGFVRGQAGLASHDQARRAERCGAAGISGGIFWRARSAWSDRDYAAARRRRRRSSPNGRTTRIPAALGRAAPARCLKVDGVPSVRHRDGGQAITTALPMTSLLGTVADAATQVAHRSPGYRSPRNETVSPPNRCGDRP